RVLRMFLSDRIAQIVPGAFVGTFIYSLLVLLAIRTPLNDPISSYVPALSLTVAIFMAMGCLGLLIFFIHHMAQILQVAVVLDLIHDELVDFIDKSYPPTESGIDPTSVDELAAQLNHTASQMVYARHPGFIRSIDEQLLLDIPAESSSWIWLRPQVGDFVPTGAILAEVGGDIANKHPAHKMIQDAFVVDKERSIYQDPLFGIRQMVDIALKALSPAINDMTTAEYALAQLGDVTGRMAVRSFPANERSSDNGRLRVIFHRPTWADFVDTAFSQIRRQAADDVHVTTSLLTVLLHLACRVPSGARAAVVLHQATEVREALATQQFSAADRNAMAHYVDEIERILLPAVAPQSDLPELAEATTQGIPR
ncbi:MAG TPA: DUF2254 domain-containing protein, partial [Roseiflexaceae bacterium]|nr:DUF2254 domain-containing protein [Roseiflexaceae bacterium]